MATTYHLDIVTPVGSLYDGEVQSVIAPGSEGYLGILAHHAALVTALIPGKLTIRDAVGKTTVHMISGGFLEVSNNRLTILAEGLDAL